MQLAGGNARYCFEDEANKKTEPRSWRTAAAARDSPRRPDPRLRVHHRGRLVRTDEGAPSRAQRKNRARSLHHSAGIRGPASELFTARPFQDRTNDLFHAVEIQKT